MKNVKLICKLFLLLVLLSSSATYSYSQDDKEARFESSYKLNRDGKLTFRLYDSDLKVNVWKNYEVKLVGEIIVSGSDTEDRELLIEAFKEPEVKSENNFLDINTEFWKNIISIGFLNRISLKNGKKVSINKFKTSYTLWIPESAEFELNSKYSDVEIADFNGIFSFDLYDTDIRTGGFGDNSTFIAKYSTIILGNGGNASFEIYDCRVTGENLKNVEIESKYSTLAFSSVNSVKVQSYDDDFDIQSLTGIQAKANYSSFLLGGQMKNSGFDLYDSDVKGGSYESLNYSAKYSELIADKIGNLNIDVIYDCTLKIGIVDDLTCNESKYDDIYLGVAATSIKMPDVYDIQLIVNKLPQTFSSFTGNFKYGAVTLNADSLLNYRLSCQKTYGSLNYPKERFINKSSLYIEKDSKTQFENSTAPDANCEISFTAYDLNFTIK